ncbi:VOC family protein [Neotabrizicola shimadae]|uniref:VOC family protein n=1 Tax=Neotabrizicola shimadae TaxID=2807096 RepID=A0A8G0ZT61_9RHOB|nr:VOC family protein [Neotabrizicola shimadae]QYZ69994.1 VOC family protein [Neotabrizicola shimadae]
MAGHHKTFENGRPEVAGQITHFEIYGDNPGTLAGFYRSLFGWQMEKLEGLNYWRIHLDPDDKDKVGGGLTYRPREDPKGWLQFVNVDSIDTSIALAEEMGARVVRPKTAVPRTAWVAVLADPAGNMFAIWQPDPLAFPEPEPD